MKLARLVFFFFLFSAGALAAGPLVLAAQTAKTEETAPDPSAQALMRAMEAVRARDWDTAMAEAEKAGAVGTDIVAWHMLRAGKGRFDDVRAFLERRADWPGLPLLRRRSEGVVPFRSRPQDVIDFFTPAPPRSGAGVVVLAAAYEAEGRASDMRALVIEAWVTDPLTAADERYLLERYGALLAPHHAERMDMLLWRGQTKAAERLLPRLSEEWQALARARLALRADRNGVDSLIAAVPDALADHPGLAFERFLWRAEKGRYEPAIELALERSGTQAALGDPDAWANWRRILARWSMRQGDGMTAYALASAHGLTEGSNYADLEWIAGYVALRYLEDPELALFHFRRFRIAVSSPISLGRAGYWEGRAHEALGDTDAAQIAYAFGAEHQTSFYGLLAAERAGFDMDAALATDPELPHWSEAGFVGSSVLEAALLLDAAGERNLAERFLVHLAESLDATGLAQLAAFAADLNEPHIALMISKQAARQGVVLPGPYFPIVDLGLEEMPVPQELALAIARRESEFDPAVTSPAGAIGLMQVMPRTAEAVADQLEVDYSREALLNDPVYNARIGVAYLAELHELFDGNLVLVAAGYNAGPSRPLRWIEERGDPRDPSVDAVDWIEHIPFRETRNYVMRVMESLPVYRARLSGAPVPIALAQELGRS